METKICRDCGKEKEEHLFRKYSRQCRKCEALYKKEYYLKTKEHKKEYTLKYYQEHKEYYKKYRDAHKEKTKKINEKYYKINKEKYKTYNLNYQKEREKTDYMYKFKRQLRKMIYNSFYRKSCKKLKDTQMILGCTYEDFIKHLLKTFKKTYEYEWNKKEKVHIDHIIPLSVANTEEEIIKLCHYTNLQLLKEKDNLQKHNKLNWELQK